MKENVGKLDQAIRGIAGPSLMLAGYTALGGGKGRPLGLLSMMAGAVVLESAVTRVCPVNTALKIDSRSPRQRLEDHRMAIERSARDFLRIAGYASRKLS